MNWQEISLRMSSLEMKNRQNNGKRVSGSDALFSCTKNRRAFLGGCADRFLFWAMAAAVLLFVLWPLLGIAAKSVNLGEGFSLAAYENLFRENSVLIRHSAFAGVLAAVCSTILGIAVALCIVTMKGNWKKIFMGILLMTMVSPPFISSLVYIQLFGKRGWITYRLLGLMLSSYNKWGIIIMQTVHFASLNALFAVGILEKLNLRLLEASKDLGASPAQTMRQVVLPMLKPAADGQKHGAGGLPLLLTGLLGAGIRLLSALFFIMMTLQYLCIFLTGFLKSKKGNYYFSLDHFNGLLTYNMESLMRSVWYSLITAAAGTLFAMLFAYYLERRKVRFRGFYDFIATMPYLLPGTCFGIGYILVFNKEPLKMTGTAAIIILNMIFKQLPMVMKLTSASLAQLNSRVEDAAGDLGAGRFFVTKHIVMPNLKRTFVTGFIYNFPAL